MWQKLFYIHLDFNGLIYFYFSILFNPIIKRFSQHSYSKILIRVNSNTLIKIANL